METLSTRILRDGPFDQLDAVGWIIRLAKGLEPIHALGVAHGSITADAIEIESSSPASRGFLVDARRLRDFPSYHSPERADGERISPENDTWAVAVILYLALTGTLPFSARTDEEVKEKIAGPPPSPLATFDVGDDALQDIIDRALHRDLAGRLANLRELREALEEWHPDAKQLPPLEDDEEQNPASGAHVMPSEGAAARSAAASSFAEPMPDEDEVTKVRTYPSRPLQQPRQPSARPAGRPQSPAATGRVRAVRLPPVTPPPPKSTRGTLLGMASPLAAPPATPAPPAVSPAAPAQVAAARPAPPPLAAQPPAAPPAAPELGLGGTVVLDSSPVARKAAPTTNADAPTPVSVQPDAPTPVSIDVDMATPDPIPIPPPVLPVVPVDSPAVIPLESGALPPPPAPEPKPSRAPAPLVEPARRKRGFLTPLLVLLVLGGGAAAAYHFRPQLFSALGVPGAPSVAVADPPRPTATPSAPASAGPSATSSAASSATSSAASSATASAEPSATSSAASSAAASAEPSATASAEPSATSSAAPASSADVGACLFPLFPHNTFVGPPTSLNTICTVVDPRKGGEVIRTEVILAGQGRILSDGMREWAIMGWYEMAAFGMLQELCCPSHPEIDIPITIPPCEIEAPLKDLVKVATSPGSDDAKVQEAVDAYTKGARCIGKQGASDSFGRKGAPQGGEDVAFKKTLDRVREAVKKKKP